ncbi:hypothetical protein pb186bvf_017930 [Paramecium bursaria]
MNQKLRLCPNFKHSGKLIYRMIEKEEFKIDRLIEFKNQFFEITISNVNLQLNETLRNAIEQHPLRNLSLNKCQITKLDLLPKIKSLESLSLDSNMLKEDQLQKLEYYYDKIELLSLMSNMINFAKLLDFVGPLKYMTNLKILNIIRNYFNRQKKQQFDCSFYIKEGRPTFFQNIPSLILLDGIERGKNESEKLTIFENSEEESYYLGLRIDKQLEAGEYFYDSQQDNQNEGQIQQNQQEQQLKGKNSNQHMIDDGDKNSNQISIQSGDSAFYETPNDQSGDSAFYESAKQDQGQSAFQSYNSSSVEQISNVNYNENKDQNSKQMEDQSEDIPNGSKKKSDDKSIEHTSIRNDEKSLSSQNKAEKQQQKQIYAIKDISESEQKKPKRKKKPQPKSNEKQNHKNKQNGYQADLNIIKSSRQADRKSARLRNVSNDDKQKKKVKQ